VPTDNAHIGDSAKSAEPVFRQAFISRPQEPAVIDRRYSGKDGFERQLFLLRKRVEKAVRESEIPQRNYFYVPSLSSNTLIYKGMLSADQIEVYFPDLADSRVESALAVVHQRFSTNTFPSWPLAHPFRYVSHNGEINTLLGNKNWMKAREAQFASELFGEDTGHCRRWERLGNARQRT
jgi:glutamate synthase domain-containing protein 1